MREFKTLPFEAKVNADKRTIEGYASTFGNKDYVGDIVDPGAFTKTIRERADRIKFLWQHSDPLGKPLRMEEDSKGLYVEAYISNTTLGNDALELVKDGVIDRFSIGYDVLNDSYENETKSRHLKELRLWEFSLVTFPANDGAALTGVKSLEEFTNLLKKGATMSLADEIKAGAVLSKSNRELINNAIKALNEVLEISEPVQKNHSQEPPALHELDPEELKTLLNHFTTGGK